MNLLKIKNNKKHLSDFITTSNKRHPISGYWNPHIGYVFHTTYLGGLVPCRTCRSSPCKLSPYSTGNWVCVGDETQMKSTQKTRNVHGQCKKFAFGTQRNLYSTDLRLGFASGVTQILGLASGVFAFLDTNMLVSPTQNSGIGGLGQRKAPTQRICIAVKYRP